MELQVTGLKGFLALFAAGILAAVIMSFLTPITNQLTSTVRGVTGGTA